MGSVGHLVTSVEGNFLWIHRDLTVAQGADTNQVPQQIAHAQEMENLVASHEELDINLNGPWPSTEELSVKALAIRADALSSNYVCYSSVGSDGNQLKKVTVTSPS